VEILSENGVRASNLPNNGENKFFSPGYGNIPKKITENDDIEARKSKLRKAAKDFEAIFARQILKSMRSTLTDGGMFGNGSAGEIYSYIMDEAVAEAIAKRGDLGLADLIYNQMVKSVEFNDKSSVGEKQKNIIKDITEK